MKFYIKTVINKTGKDQTKVYAWDVVNEAIDNGQGYIKTSPWSLVDDYICKAYKYAHQAAPQVPLLYNDYKHASTSGVFKTKSDKVFKMIKAAVSKGCPIHGVGF